MIFTWLVKMSQDLFSCLISGLRLCVLKFYARDCPQNTSANFGIFQTSHPHLVCNYLTLPNPFITRYIQECAINVVFQCTQIRFLFQKYCNLRHISGFTTTYRSKIMVYVLDPDSFTCQPHNVLFSALSGADSSIGDLVTD